MPSLHGLVLCDGFGHAAGLGSPLSRNIMTLLACPYLKGYVELTGERAEHIHERHPELLPACAEQLAATLADPDSVRRSARFTGARLFSRWFDNISGGKQAVVSDVGGRNWVITAYLASKLAEGDIEWKRS